MKLEEIRVAEKEAERFLAKVNDLWDLLQGNERSASYVMMIGSPETSAVKRASMDLTRSLAKMRNPNSRGGK